MARLRFLEAADSPEPSLVADAYGQVESWGRPVGHLYQVLANQPRALEAFLGMSHYIRDSSSLDDRLREIAVLSTANALAQPYERAHHEPVALAAGVAREVIESLASGEFDALEGLDRAVACYADQVARRRDVDDEVFHELRRSLSDGELTDLVVTVGWYHLCAAILGPLHVELEREYAAK